MCLQWITYTPTSVFPVIADGAAYASVIRQEGGEEAARQWELLSRQLLPLQEAAAALPTLALRADPGQPSTDQLPAAAACPPTVLAESPAIQALVP